MNTNVTLQSGARLEITMLSFQEGLKLFQAISKELKNVDLSGLNIQSLDSELDINALKNLVLQFIASDDLMMSIRPALDRALYNDQKIKDEAFDSVEARSDYFLICWEVLKYNLTPFLPKNVFGLLKK